LRREGSLSLKQLPDTRAEAKRAFRPSLAIAAYALWPGACKLIAGVFPVFFHRTPYYAPNNESGNIT
jgi:hypothetical protein